MQFTTINPANGKPLNSYETLSALELEEKVAKSARAFMEWRHTSFSERAVLMNRVADILERDSDVLASLMTAEMGKPIRSAKDEATKCARACRHYAENAQHMLSDDIIETDEALCRTMCRPLGPILAIMPWNFPFWQVFRFAAPALMAGNVGLLKHASNVPECAMRIEAIFKDAGFPEGVFQTLLIRSTEAGSLIGDTRIQALTLTGSENAERSVAESAGRALKKVVLELGGSDPFIVTATADVRAAVAAAVKSRTVNNGQSCIAAKRFILLDSIADEFEAAFVETMKNLVVGDPLDESTEIGPLATEGILNELDEQVQASIKMGAKLLTGGARVNRPSFYYEPTVLTYVPPQSPAATEELFGPVASIFRAEAVDQAIEIANDTRFGLGASVWTQDNDERSRFIEEIDAGMVFVNGMVVSDPRLPFGGVKRSGFGRELGGAGIREFVNIKSISIAK